MLVRTIVDGDPCEDHRSFGYGAELHEDGRTSVRFFDVADGNESLVDGLEQVLVHGHLGAVQIGLLGLGGDEQEVTLSLETLQNLGGLYCEHCISIACNFRLMYLVPDGPDRQ